MQCTAAVSIARRFTVFLNIGSADQPTQPLVKKPNYFVIDVFFFLKVAFNFPVCWQTSFSRKTNFSSVSGDDSWPDRHSLFLQFFFLFDISRIFLILGLSVFLFAFFFIAKRLLIQATRETNSTLNAQFEEQIISSQFHFLVSTFSNILTRKVHRENISYSSALILIL